MSLRVSLGIPDSGIGNRGSSRFAARLERVLGVIYIIYSLEVGLALIFLPWLELWTNNPILYRYPVLQPVIGNPYLRGAVLGLGIVNVFIGLQEIGRIRRGCGGFFSR